MISAGNKLVGDKRNVQKLTSKMLIGAKEEKQGAILWQRWWKTGDSSWESHINLQSDLWLTASALIGFVNIFILRIFSFFRIYETVPNKRWPYSSLTCPCTPSSLTPSLRDCGSYHWKIEVNYRSEMPLITSISCAYVRYTRLKLLLPQYPIASH